MPLATLISLFFILIFIGLVVYFVGLLQRMTRAQEKIATQLYLLNNEIRIVLSDKKKDETPNKAVDSASES